MHTSEGSKCSRLTAVEQVHQYKDAGYDGVIITDHFVNGNSSVDRTLPWIEQMRIQFSGFRAASIEGDRIGLKVFEGIEFAYNGTEFIVLGLGEDWFICHEETKDMSPDQFLPIFREAGAAVIHAHPYREAPYIHETRLYPNLVDAVEGFNLQNAPEWNNKAFEYAQVNNLPITAGSDCHHIGNYGAGIELVEEPRDINDLVRIIKSGKGWNWFDEIR